MAFETEKKYRISHEQRESVIEALKDYAAVFVSEEFETNILYHGGIIDENKSLLRIRETGSRTTLTFKQSHQQFEGIKRHIEHETEVSNAESVKEILASLGFMPGIIYEKRRQTWNLSGIEVVIDELPFGQYIEIEGSLTDIAKAEMMLEMEDFEVEHYSYPRLSKHYGKVIGDVIEARFDQSSDTESA